MGSSARDRLIDTDQVGQRAMEDASATFVGSTSRSVSPSDEGEVAFVSPCALSV
jgi:hypothetical protein